MANGLSLRCSALLAWQNIWKSNKKYDVVWVSMRFTNFVGTVLRSCALFSQTKMWHGFLKNIVFFHVKHRSRTLLNQLACGQTGFVRQEEKVTLFEQTNQ